MLRKPHHRIVLYVLTGAFVAAFAVQYIHDRYDPAKDFEQINSPPPVETSTPQNVAKDKTSAPPRGTAPKESLPITFLLKVPFTPQAPTANWDQLHNEACEEASAIMTATYFGAIDNGAHQTDVTLPPAFVEVQLSKLTQWEQNHFGYYLDINSQELAQLITEVYGLQTKILTDYSESDIKGELLQNHVVLLPANGIKLGNPNFRSPGPPYHMLVIKGYNANTFITNDPGTRKGLNYPYTFKTLYAANGDFDHATHTVDLSKKNVIVVWK